MHSQHRQQILAVAIAGIFGTAAFTYVTPANAQATVAQSQQFDIKIPAQSLSASLAALSKQTGIQVLSAGNSVANVTAPAISGQYTVQQALNALLAGSNLSAAATSNGTYTVRKSSEAAADSVLPEVKVQGYQETATGPLQHYAAKRSATGTKTDTPLIETPQSISIVGAEQIEVTKAQSISEALGYSAGIARGDFTDRVSDAVVVRGFEVFTGYRDGTKFQFNYFDGQQEPYGLERVEVLKGAASVLYGNANPGGLVNAVSKRPTTQRLRELNVEYGSFDRKQVSGDFGGALSEDGVWSYRLTGLFRESNTFIDHIRDDRTYIAPALTWKPNAVTSLTFLSEYQKDKTAYVSGYPLSGTVQDNINGRIPRNRFMGEPGFDKYDIERYSVGYLFEHAFTDNLKLRNSLRYSRVESQWAAITGQVLQADQRTITRNAQVRDNLTTGLTSDTSLQYNWGSENVSNTTLVGVDYSKQKYQTIRANSTAVGSLDLYAPVYGSTVTLGPRSGSINEMDILGIYFQNQMKINKKLVVLLGGRQDHATVNDRDLFTGANPAGEQKNSAFTGRAGVVYLADNGLAPYASFGQSFEPQSGRDRLGNRFNPTKGEQYEIGIRYQPPGTDTMLSAAVYQLTQSDVLGSDPVNTTFRYQVGEIRSKGFELEAKTRIGRNANLIAAYANTDSRTTKASPVFNANVGQRVGGLVGGVPKDQVSIWGDYTFGAFGVPGLKVGSGIRYVGTTASDFITVKTPAYTVLDAMLAYTLGPWKFSLNATNLTDKTYEAVCPFRCFYGEPRRVIGTLSYRW